MEKKLFRVKIKTYHYGIVFFELFVLTENVGECLKLVHKHPLFANDEDAEVESFNEIPTDVSRVLN